MKFSILDLIAFGHFSNETLRFASTPGVVEVIYGDNEAGKTTSLRAIGSFLYGIPVRTTDDWFHPMPTLRVGATVVGADGGAVTCVRRKGQKDTLRDINDVPLDPGFLERMLAGLDREMFEKMYSLSREQLALGAADLLTGNGALGEALFGASLGLAGINELLRDLEAEAAEIFKPRGENPKLNSLVAALDDLRRRARDAELRPTDYHGLQLALAVAVQSRDELETDLSELEQNLLRLDRYQRLIPLAAQRVQIQGDLEPYADAPVLAEEAREQRLAAERDLDAAQAEIERGKVTERELGEALQALAPRPVLVAHAPQIRELHRSIGEHQKAARDLPGVKAAQRATIAEAELLLRQAHPERKIGDAEELRLSLAEVASIDALAKEHVRLDEAHRNADETLADERRSLERVRRSLETTPEPVDIAPLRATLEAARKLGEIEDHLAAEATSLDATNERLAPALASIGFAGSPTDLEGLPVPTDAGVARFADEEERLRRAAATLSAQVSAVEGRLRDEQQALEALDLRGAVLTEADLDETRGRRQSTWRLIKAALTGNKLERPSDEVLVTYESFVQEVDDIADRLRREADRVATKAGLEAGIGRGEREIETLAAQVAALDEESASLKKEWLGLWEPAQITPRTAVEMREWLDKRARILETIESLRAARLAHDSRTATVERHLGAIVAALSALGHSVAKDVSLKAALAIGEELVARYLGQTAAHSSALDRLDDAEQREHQATLVLAAAIAALEEWAERWGAAVVRIGLEPSVTPEIAGRVIAALAEMFVRLDAAANYKSRIDSMARDAKMFTDDVAALVTAVAPELGQLTADQAVTELQQMLDAAQKDATQAEMITKQLSDLGTALDAARDRASDASGTLARLTSSAGCSTTQELIVAEERWAAAVSLRSTLAAVEEKMVLIAGAPAATIAAEVSDLDLSGVDADILRLERQKLDLSPRRKELGEAVGRARSAIDACRGSDHAAQLHEEAESIKADIRLYAERYARLRLAAALLRREIDNFRERSHGPLLIRAGYYFSMLTRGRYTGLATGFDAKENIVILGRRKNGRELTVDRMSTGARDQLYLALRLATLEQQAERGEPLPLIVDDLFEGYDDKRAAAGFLALAEIANHTQVIFFTHHHHLVEIGRQTLAGRCSVQELNEPLAVSAEAA